MGGLSSAWKSIKGGFKKIGKGVKKAFKKFGKFMGKIGFLGQLAMTFLLPGIGGLMAKGLGSLFGITNVTSFAGFAGQLASSGNIIAKAAGTVMRAGQWVFNKAQYPFKTITNAVTNFGKFAVNKVGSAFGVQPFADAGMQGFMKDMSSFHQGVQKKGMEFKIARGDFEEVGNQVLSDISGSKYKVMSPEEGRYVDNINALKERRAGVDLAIEDAASGLKMKKTPVIDMDIKNYTEKVAAQLAETDRQLFNINIEPEQNYGVLDTKRPPRSILYEDPPPGVRSDHLGDFVDTTRTNPTLNIETGDSLIEHSGRSRHANLEVVDDSTSSVFKEELEKETENFFDITNRSTWNVKSLRNSARKELSGGANKMAVDTFKSAVLGGGQDGVPDTPYNYSTVPLGGSPTAQSDIYKSFEQLRQPANQDFLNHFNRSPNWLGYEPVY